jgi:hypothetical protein
LRSATYTLSEYKGSEENIRRKPYNLRVTEFIEHCRIN